MSDNLTRDLVFEFGHENVTMLKILRKSFASIIVLLDLKYRLLVYKEEEKKKHCHNNGRHAQHFSKPY